MRILFLKIYWWSMFIAWNSDFYFIFIKLNHFFLYLAGLSRWTNRRHTTWTGWTNTEMHRNGKGMAISNISVSVSFPKNKQTNQQILEKYYLIGIGEYVWLFMPSRGCMGVRECVCVCVFVNVNTILKILLIDWNW